MRKVCRRWTVRRCGCRLQSKRLADCYTALVAGYDITFVGAQVDFDDFGQCEGCHYPAAIFAAIGFLTGLLALWGFDAMHPDFRIAYLNHIQGRLPGHTAHNLSKLVLESGLSVRPEMTARPRWTLDREFSLLVQVVF
jgi:hypothetical protein